MPRLSFIAPLALAALAAGSSAWAQDPPRAKVTELFKQPYLEQPGKEVRAFLVEFPPRAASIPHSHPGPIFAYVLKGTWTLQMQGEPLARLSAGQVAYERSGQPHAVSRNDSDTEPLQLVVFYVSEPGAAVSVPLAK